MNKKGISYDNSLRYSANDPRRPDAPVSNQNAGATKKQQSKTSLHRSAEMAERYRAQPKILMHGLATAGQHRQASPSRNLENRPGWNDRLTTQKNAYKDKLDARAIRSDYGKDIPVTTSNPNIDITQQMLALQSKDQLAQLREMVQNDKIIKTNEIQKKSGMEVRELQESLAREDKIKRSYESQLAQKYEKIEEQKNLNAFLEGQIRVIRSHRKDVSKAKALEGPTQKSIAKERQSREREVLNNTWNDQLDEMRQIAEAKQAKAKYTQDYLRREQEEEAAAAAQAAAALAGQDADNKLDYYPRREDMSMNNMLQSGSPARKRQSNQFSMDEGVGGYERKQQQQQHDGYLEISKQEAWRQYDISKTLKNTRQERLSEKAHYLHVEKSLGQFQQRVMDPALQEEKQQVNGSVFSGSLIGRAASKLIKVHHEEIIEMLVDEMCLEMVAILSKEDAVKHDECEKMTRECLVNDYLDEFREMAYEQSEIVDRMKMKKAQRANNHEPFSVNLRQTQPHEYDGFYVNKNEAEIQHAKIELSLGIVVSILDKKSEFLRYINRLDYYQKKNLQTFTLIMEGLLDDMMSQVVQEVDQANDQYAELMFQHEFK